MPLTNFVTDKLVTCRPEQSVQEAADLMKSHDVGAILVIDEQQKPVGMITDRDIVLRCVTSGLDCSTVHAKNIMTRAVKSVRASEGLMDILKSMKESSIRRIPIVDDMGKAVGLISFGDVLELLVSELSFLVVPATPEKKKIDKHAA